MNKWDNRFLRIAQEVASWSKDPDWKVGAVIVSPDNRIISTGYNGEPAGLEFNKDKLGIIHAELNALLNSKVDVRGCIMYVHPLQPCIDCTAAIIQSGIKRVVYIDDNVSAKWHPSIAKQFFEKAKIFLQKYTVH